MELARDLAPFVLGLIVPPIVMIAVRRNWSGGSKFALAFGTSIVLALAVSFFAHQLGPQPLADFDAVLVNTSLIYTGSQLAYWSFWRPALEPGEQANPSFAKEPAHRPPPR